MIVHVAFDGAKRGICDGALDSGQKTSDLR